ncbi:ComEC/Rec2 family competence protein [Candidatus Collierbacteria bacterium]|nr:ComEC/Rec2 family competence protein [Candidatus Collierbacteria bacterium]
MKSTSPSLFRFVFWVFIIYSVLLRQYLWLNYSYLTKEGEEVRVKDVLLMCGKCQQSKYNFLFTNISVKNIDFSGKNTELVNSLSSNQIVATGILESRVTGDKFSGLVLREAQIISIINRQPILTKVFINLVWSADKVVDHFGYTLGKFFSKDESALISGLLTGRLDGAGMELINRLKSSGLLHLAAASGYNVTMVISLGWGLSFWILPRKLMKYFVILFVTLFMFVSNFSPSVVRAGIMGLSGYWAAEIAGSRRSAKRIFLATAGLLLFLFPDWLYDIGFQLSFAATAGMLWLEPRINQLSVLGYRLSDLGQSVVGQPVLKTGKQGLWPLFSESLAANLSVAPVLIWHFGWKQLGIWGVLLNIPASFLVGPLMGLGLAVLIFGTWFPVAAQVLTIAGKPLLLAMTGLIEIGARLKGQ